MPSTQCNHITKNGLWPDTNSGDSEIGKLRARAYIDNVIKPSIDRNELDTHAYEKFISAVDKDSPAGQAFFSQMNAFFQFADDVFNNRI